MSPKEIKGRWKAGWALDAHTLSSIPNTDGTYNTTRSKIGETVFQLKYRHNQEPMGFLVQELVTSCKPDWFYHILMLSSQHHHLKIGIFNLCLK